MPDSSLFDEQAFLDARRVLGTCAGCASGEMTPEEIRAAEDRHLAQMDEAGRSRALGFMRAYDVPYHELALAMTKLAFEQAVKERAEAGEAIPSEDVARVQQMLDRLVPA